MDPTKAPLLQRMVETFGDAPYPDFEPGRVGINTMDAKAVYVGKSLTSLGAEGARNVLNYIDELGVVEFSNLLPAILYQLLIDSQAETLWNRLDQLNVVTMGPESRKDLSDALSKLFKPEPSWLLEKAIAEVVILCGRDDQGGDCLFPLAFLKRALALG